jgi:site-specific recombinase XerD
LVSVTYSIFVTHLLPVICYLSNGKWQSNSKFKKVLKQATRDNVFADNPAQDVSNKRPENTVRKDILSSEEIQLLAKTQCGNE